MSKDPYHQTNLLSQVKNQYIIKLIVLNDLKQSEIPSINIEKENRSLFYLTCKIKSNKVLQSFINTTSPIFFGSSGNLQVVSKENKGICFLDLGLFGNSLNCDKIEVSNYSCTEFVIDEQEVFYFLNPTRNYIAMTKRMRVQDFHDNLHEWSKPKFWRRGRNKEGGVNVMKITTWNHGLIVMWNDGSILVYCTAQGYEDKDLEIKFPDEKCVLDFTYFLKNKEFQLVSYIDQTGLLVMLQFDPEFFRVNLKKGVKKTAQIQLDLGSLKVETLEFCQNETFITLATSNNGVPAKIFLFKYEDEKINVVGGIDLSLC